MINEVQAQVFSDVKLIGSTVLSICDESMGAVSGEFFPNEEYYDLVQKTVWGFTETGNNNLWQSLRLNIQLENGFFLYPHGGYTISDSPVHL